MKHSIYMVSTKLAGLLLTLALVAGKSNITHPIMTEWLGTRLVTAKDVFTI